MASTPSLLYTTVAGAAVRIPVDGARLHRSHGFLAAGSYLLWAGVEETAEVRSRAVEVQQVSARLDGPALITSLRAGPVFMSRRCAALPDRPGVVLWYEHAGGPRLVLRVRVVLAARPQGALAFASDGARLTPEFKEDGGVRLRLFAGTPPLVFYPTGAAFVAHPLWRAVRYSEDRIAGRAAEEDLPSPGFFFSILAREGEVARIVGVADDEAEPVIPDLEHPGGVD